MKKFILSVTVALILSATFMSCEKESKVFNLPKPVIPIQPGSVEQLIAKADPQPGTDGNSYELGVVFKSAVNGNIKSFKLHLPQTGNYLVTLWKMDDKSIVTNNQIACTHINSWEDSVEVNVPITGNTAYILSVNASIFYYFNSGPGVFPYTNGDITLTGYAGNIGSTQTFPALALSQTPAGFVDFTFQKSE